MITIDFLADHPAVIPTLVEWFRGQWPDYFADKSQAQIAQDFLSEASRDHIPSRLVAFDADVLAGTIVLRTHANKILPEFKPGLGGLFVVETYRGRGVGTELVRAGMKIATDRGYETIYATTVAAVGILERLGWDFVKTIVHDDEQLALYQCKL